MAISVDSADAPDTIVTTRNGRGSGGVGEEIVCRSMCPDPAPTRKSCIFSPMRRRILTPHG